MKTLSIRQPWADLIAKGHKQIENRTWPTSYRGPLLIHASKGGTRREHAEVAEFLLREKIDVKLPAFDDLERGGIVGVCEVVGCVTDSVSPWFFGPYGFELANIRPLPFVPLKGRLGLFDVQERVLRDAFYADCDRNPPAPGLYLVMNPYPGDNGKEFEWAWFDGENWGMTHHNKEVASSGSYRWNEMEDGPRKYYWTLP